MDTLPLNPFSDFLSQPAFSFQILHSISAGQVSENVHELIDKYEVTNAQYATFLNEYGKNTDAAGHELLDVDQNYCLIEKVGSTYQPKAGYENPLLFYPLRGFMLAIY